MNPAGRGDPVRAEAVLPLLVTVGGEKKQRVKRFKGYSGLRTQGPFNKKRNKGYREGLSMTAEAQKNELAGHVEERETAQRRYYVCQRLGWKTRGNHGGGGRESHSQLLVFLVFVDRPGPRPSESREVTASWGSHRKPADDLTVPEATKGKGKKGRGYNKNILKNLKKHPRFSGGEGEEKQQQRGKLEVGAFLTKTGSLTNELP